MVTRECTFETKILYPECTCPFTCQNGQVTSTYVANKYLEDFGKNPNWEVSGVKHHVMQQISVDLSISQVYRSRKAARGLIIGNEKAQYGLLKDYAEMIRRTDVGSKVILQTEMENENVEPKYKRMYIRYNAQKVGFLGGCRPFVGLDGCHLKGRFGGQLLFITAKDGNDNIFPVAMAVVVEDNKDRWISFLEQFANDIGKLEELNLALLPVMETLFLIVEHKYCVKHTYNNFKVNDNSMELKSVLWRCANTTSVREFERAMDHPNSLDEEARDKPILSMLEWIRVRLMTRLYTKEIGIEKSGGKLCSSIKVKLEKLKLESKSFCVMPSMREVEGLLHTDNDPRPHLHHRHNPQLSLTLWPYPYPTRKQGHNHSHKLHNHKLHGHSHQLHGHRTQVSGTLQTSGRGAP
ncbi:uncharacterized protein LOC142635894 [Castanea sativa]|uniref:uncharacterized protein LOC142635894 n=1 Tax=Castanea sativa TaxID=21020 RepID=UPI003F6509B8